MGARVQWMLLFYLGVSLLQDKTGLKGSPGSASLSVSHKCDAMWGFIKNNRIYSRTFFAFGAGHTIRIWTG